MANITVNTPSPSADMPAELRAIWEHISELENQLMNVLSNLDGENFTEVGIKELKRSWGFRIIHSSPLSRCGDSSPRGRAKGGQIDTPYCRMVRNERRKTWDINYRR